MSNLFFIAISFALIWSTRTMAFDMPGFSSPEDHLSSITYAPFHAKVKYDNNLGRLNLSFELPLPVGRRPIRNALIFNYNSQLAMNVGYGVGFDLQLPYLQKNQRHDRADFLYDNGESVIELGLRDNRLVELELGQFNQYERLNGLTIIRSNDGVIRTFSSLGLLIKEEFPGQDNIVFYEWDNFRLTGIVMPQGRLNFLYQECSIESKDIKNGSFPVFYQGGFREQNKCLTSVEYGDRRVDFAYNEYRNLLSVNWNGREEQAIFKASYDLSRLGEDRKEEEQKHNDLVATGTLNIDSIMAKLGDGRVHFFSEHEFYANQGIQKSKLLGFDEGGHIGQIFPADFNNDGYTDYLIYKSYRNPGKTEGTGLPFGRTNKDGSWEPLEMEVRFGGTDEKGELVFTQAPSKFQLSDRFKIAHLGSEKNSWALVMFPTVPIFGDFDGNRRVDILLCGQSSGIAYNTTNGFIEHNSIKCPAQSVAYDVNLDGYTDLITNDKIYFGSPEGLIEGKSSSPEIKDIQNKIKSKDLKFGLGDLDLDGMPEPLQKKDFYFISDVNDDKNFEVWKVEDGLGHYYKRKTWPLYPLIKEVIHSEGGRVKVDFDISSSIPVVSEVIYDNLQGLPRLESFDYHGPFAHPLTSELMGFKLVEKVDHPASEYFSGRKEVFEYFRDNAEDDVLKRAFKHGLVSRKFVCSMDGCKDLVHELLKQQRISATYLKAIDYKYPLIHPFNDQRYFIYKGQEVTRNYEDHQVAHAGRFQVDIKTEETSYFSFSDHGPLTRISTAYENIKNTAQQKQSIVHLAAVDGRLLPVHEEIKGTDGRRTLTLSLSKYSYSGSLKSGDFKVQKEVFSDLKYSYLNLVEVHSFNPNGLLASVQNSFGGVTTYQYEGLNFNSLVSREQDGMEKNELVDDFNNIIYKSVSSKGREILKSSLVRDEMGRVTSIDTGMESYHINYTPVQGGVKLNAVLSGSKGNVMSVDQHYDGFGQLLRLERRQNGKTFVLKDQNLDSKGLVVSEGKKTLLAEGGVYSPQTIFEHTYDGESRPLQEFNRFLESVRQFKHRGHSLSLYEDGHLIHKERRNGLGLMVEMSTNTLTVPVLENEEQKLFNLADYSFERDLLGRITEVRKGKGPTLFDQTITPNLVRVNSGHYLIYRNDKGNVTDLTMGGKFIQRFSFDEFSRLNKLEAINSFIQEEVVYGDDNTIKEEKIEVPGRSIYVQNTYDDMKDLESQKLEAGIAKYELKFTSELGLVRAVAPHIKNISYDAQGRPASVEFKNLSLKIDSDLLGYVQSLRMGGLEEKYRYNERMLIQERVSGKASKKFEYDLDKRLLELPSKSSSQRDEYSNLLHPGLSYSHAQSGVLASIDGKEVNYRTLESIARVGEELYVSSDLHVIGRITVKYFRLGQKIIGAMICEQKCKFYPIFTDHQNTVKAIFNEAGDLLVQRSHSAWGELEDTTLHSGEAKKIDRLIRYDFAGLIRPYESEFLLSSTRVYAPMYGEWHKIDPLLYQNPEIFLKGKPLESDGLSYAAGDPINKIDPSGEVATPWLFVGGIMFGGFVGSINEMISNPEASTKDILISGAVGGAATAGMLLLGPRDLLGASTTAGAIYIASQILNDKEIKFSELLFTSLSAGVNAHGSSAFLNKIGNSKSIENSISLVTEVVGAPIAILFQAIMSRDDQDRRNELDALQGGYFQFTMPQSTGSQLLNMNQMSHQQSYQFNYSGK